MCISEQMWKKSLYIADPNMCKSKAVSAPLQSQGGIEQLTTFSFHGPTLTQSIGITLGILVLVGLTYIALRYCGFCSRNSRPRPPAEAVRRWSRRISLYRGQGELGQGYPADPRFHFHGGRVEHLEEERGNTGGTTRGDNIFSRIEREK